MLHLQFAQHGKARALKRYLRNTTIQTFALASFTLPAKDVMITFSSFRLVVVLISYFSCIGALLF